MTRTLVRRFLIGGVVAVLLCAAAMGDDTSPSISDETLRLAALRAIFPGMQVSIDPGKRINDTWPENLKDGQLRFPDALADESVYKVVGRAMNRAESWASSDVTMPNGRLSTVRQVRFRLFRWPNEGDAGLLAVLQYDFPKARPPMSCASIGLLVHLVKDAANWSVKGQYLLETTHHHSLQGIRLLDLTGRGANELVVESNNGGAGVGESSLQVFDLSRGSFHEVLGSHSLMQDSAGNLYSQVLDIGRTRESGGQRLCFSKTTYLENGKAFRPPRVTRPCYRRGEGVQPNDNELLAPVH
jgi:hypothetical protein